MLEIDGDDNRCVVISGCSGGGKSTLLAALRERGFHCVDEPGRRIVAEEIQQNDVQQGGGRALPWVDLDAFARRAIAMAARDMRAAQDNGAKAAGGWIFFDRGIVDAAVALQTANGTPASGILRQYPRYHRMVFMTPPWPAIYATDSARRHGLDEAIAEHERLMVAYQDFGYETILLPKIGVMERVEFVLRRLGI